MKDKMNTLINKLSDEPFKYGKNDCFTFTNALFKEWHGHDYVALHPYKNKKEALRYLEKHGGLEIMTVGTLGYPVNAEFCEDGDVVMANVGPGNTPALGFVYDGNGLFKGEKRVLKLPLSKCERGWRAR